MRIRTRLLAAAVLSLSAAAQAQIDARLLRYPDVSAREIAFVYAGDVWLVPKEGGTAQRLSTPPGEESFPRFSPDGQALAFSGNYDGNTDLYVVPAAGGLPTRLTHHPATDRMLEWYPDGQTILFASGMTSGKDRFNQLWKVSRSGGLPERLPVPYGEFGTITPDGAKLAYMPATRAFRTWKRYRGGCCGRCRTGPSPVSIRPARPTRPSSPRACSRAGCRRRRTRSSVPAASASATATTAAGSAGGTGASTCAAHYRSPAMSTSIVRGSRSASIASPRSRAVSVSVPRPASHSDTNSPG